MQVTTLTATLLIAGGLIALVLLLRVLGEATRGTTAELRRASKKLRAAAASLERQSGKRVPPAQVRETMESIAVCARILRSTASDAHAAALESIERSTALLASALDSTAARRGARRAR